MSARYAVVLLLLAFAIIAGSALAIWGIIEPPYDLRPLGLFYIENSLLGKLTAGTPEAVTAIVWDYRGLDTLFETLVLFLAIVGGIAIFEVKGIEAEKRAGVGLTHIARTGAKIVIVPITIIAFSIALHGHLTPGGGFQGGATIAIAPLLLIPIFGYYELLEKGITSPKLVAARGFALTMIAMVAILPVLRGLEAVSNAAFYPIRVGGMLISGSIIWYNLFEFIAVGTGFTAIFLYMSVEEEVYSREVVGR